MTAAPKAGRTALWILPAVLVPAVFLAIVFIGRPPVILVTIAAAVMVILMMSYANYLSYRAMRRLDEVQRAGAAFAGQWGPAAGQAIFALLLGLPPFKDVATAAVRGFIGTFVNHPIPVDETVVVLALAFGFTVLVFLEGLGRIVAHTLWWTGKR